MTMPVTTQAPSQPRPRSHSGVVPYRLTVRQFEKMIDEEIFSDGDHVELLDGILVDKMKKNPPHNFGVRKLATLLRGLLPVGWFVDEEKSIRDGKWSRPEPDVTVIRGRAEDYALRDPTGAEVGIVAEVADSSYPKDRGKKWRKYAAARIPIYWILNLPQRQIEVYTDPSGQGKSASFRDSKIYGQNDEVPVTLDGRELGRIKVGDVLPLIAKS